MKNILALSLCLGLLLTACQSTDVDTPAPTPGVSTLKVNWHYDNPEWYMIGYSALFDDLYFKPGKVKAYNVHTQKPAFELPLTTDSLRTSYAELDGNILVFDKDNQLSVVSRDGTILNTIKTGNTSVTIHNVGPFVTDTGVYVALGKTLYKYNRSDLLKPGAQPAWTWEPKLQNYGFIAALNVVSDDEIYVATRSDDYNHLISLKADRTERWNINLNPGNPPDQSSTAIAEIYGDTVITHASTYGVQAYDRATGKEVWAKAPNLDDHCELGGVGFAMQAVIEDDKIFVAPYANKCVMALNAKTGQFLWSFNSPYRSSFGNKVLYLNDVVYATNGRLWALDADTGKLLAQANEDLKPNEGTPLTYDPVRNQILTWGGTGVSSYQPLK